MIGLGHKIGKSQNWKITKLEYHKIGISQN